MGKKGQISSFEKLHEMRKKAKTGGALGQISSTKTGGALGQISSKELDKFRKEMNKQKKKNKKWDA